MDESITDSATANTAGWSEATTCEYCSCKFPTLDDLRCHYEEHTIELIKMSGGPVNPGGITPSLFVCRYCGEWYFKRNHLIVHEREHTGRAFFKCAQCGKAFINSSKLKRHEATHLRAMMK
ncbi:hypothetical protein GJ496_010880 [Pomphorhynchus laevis]|nr:hypothetical protein GJ496_010880 [Pomphorhynchus laevis]